MTLNKNDDCIFCRIAEGKSPCAELYSDDLVMAFLDIAPVNKGHALVIPKAHYQDIFEMPATMGEALIRAQQHVGNAIMAATKAEGLNIYMNNKAAAGQVVFHAHWHLNRASQTIPCACGRNMFTMIPKRCCNWQPRSERNYVNRVFTGQPGGKL
jgi:histidine triad (HIT) family protein